MKYYLVAGEASGDLHGSNLMKGLVKTDPQAQFRFWGGKLMQQVGGELVQDYKEGAVMGTTDTLAKAGKLLGNIRNCKKDIINWQPGVVILIDYPGFNMKIAKFCHRNKIKVFYYIVPKTWASREGRNRKLKKWTDKLFIVFPFEIPYFEKKRIPFIYKGNPLIDAVDESKETYSCGKKYIAMLAGSRKGEISRMMPVCMDLADKMHSLKQYRDYQFIIAGAPARGEEDYLEYIGGRKYVTLIFDKTYAVLRGADAAVINSGTASLEAALISTPQVVGWSTSKLTFFLAKHILKVQNHVRFISLGNLIIDKQAFKEFIQDDFNSENLLKEMRQILEDKEYRIQMQSDYADIRTLLGKSGASLSVAKAMVDELKG